MFEKIGNVRVRRLKACVAARTVIMRLRCVTSMALSTDTEAPQRQTTRGETHCYFCDASRITSFELPEPQTGPGGPKTLISTPWLIFFDDRAADGRKHGAKMRMREISRKNAFFAKCTFP